jgi:hypothetical protein
MFAGYFAASIVAAIAIYRDMRIWGRVLGFLLAARAFVGYIISRTIGLRGMGVEDWLVPMGLLSLVCANHITGLIMTDEKSGQIYLFRRQVFLDHLQRGVRTLVANQVLEPDGGKSLVEHNLFIGQLPECMYVV